MYSSNRLYLDWCNAEPNEPQRKMEEWDGFLTKMKELYKPTENNTLRNFHFRSLMQQEGESFTGFCNRVQKEAKHCNFKCPSNGCTAENIAVRDQIVIGLVENSIRQEALKKLRSV